MKAAQPFFGGADPTRLAAAIEGARAAGVADAVVAPAEAKLQALEAKAQKAATAAASPLALIGRDM